MKKVIAALLLTGIAFMQVQAQQQTPFGKSDPKAKAILDAASAKFKTYKSIKAGFSLKITTPDNKVMDTKTGTVYLKGKKYKVLLDGQEIYCDGSTTWSYNKDTKEVQISAYTPDNATLTPDRLFSNFYDKEFLYRLSGSSTHRGKPVDVIEMTPLDKSKPFFKVVVQIDKAAKNIVSTEIFEQSGNRYTYEITAFTPNAAMADNSFTFDAKAHPGVEVVDLR
ncbi:outer membrane lipoprotein carrier protein LolA [Compostibacter hankyongensis]|uniref:Outer membrane lipoprotein carrier protein LolA n=1 Tax=Compostibacter hankyongensis TaxID=1007089 RepID=A0ABP8G2C5_9BACT